MHVTTQPSSGLETLNGMGSRKTVLANYAKSKTSVVGNKMVL